MAVGSKKPGLYATYLKPMGRYMPSILIPGFFFGLIFVDWNHTRKWKAEKARRLQEIEAAASN